jgi:RND family efflux transporter, MFP subunit
MQVFTTKPTEAQEVDGTTPVAETAVAANTPPETVKAPGHPKRAPKKKRKWPVRLAIVAVLVAAVYFFFIKPAQANMQQMLAQNFLPEVATVRDLVVTVKGTATIQAIDAYRVSTLVRGEILEAPFEEGDVLEEGALIYRIDAFDAETAIEQAELALRQATLNYNDLLENQSRSGKNLVVRATAAGTITKLHVEQGDMVAAGAPIATIVDRESMLLAVPFHSVDAAGFAIGQSATVSVTGSMEQLTAVIDEIAPIDTVGAGGTLVRMVTFQLKNPGILSATSTGTASVGSVGCAAVGGFFNSAEETVYAKSSGEIEYLPVSEGDRVTKDQLLAQMPEISYASQREQAEISMRNAQLNLEKARNALDNYTITTPIQGTVVKKSMKEGDNIDATTSGFLAVIYDMSVLTFDMRIDELDIGKIAIGQTVEITAEAYPGEVYYGWVEKINIDGQTASGVTVYPVTIHIDNAGKLLPGMNINAEILCEEVKNVLTVPMEAVAQGNVVLVPTAGALGADGTLVDVSKLESVPITIGRNNRDYIEVTSGLAEGDTVFIEVIVESMMSLMMRTG